MIGVICKETEKIIVSEFFELFKTPWEFYQENQTYEVVLITNENDLEIRADLLIIYGSERKAIDDTHGVMINSCHKGIMVEWRKKYFPIYGKTLIFKSHVDAILPIKGKAEYAGFEIKRKKISILRLGFDLFWEIYFLLSSGQPEENAQIPTLEIHIEMLRDLILEAGIPLIEVPPIPDGYKFIGCLTHDVDFVGIRRHKFDHTMLGFIYRALFVSLLETVKGQKSWKILLNNWKAVISLPLIYIGLMKDFMIQFDRYIEIENGFKSTFFLIPFKNTPGLDEQERTLNRRAAKYDVMDILSEVKKLHLNGNEIGLHGIDAWRDTEIGRQELKQISQVIGNLTIGVRMHWLYFSQQSPQILEQAGFSYDSTVGYNNVIGYRAGTMQVFRPIGAQKLFELPMHIMDTALFYPSRMGLTETSALKILKKFFFIAKKYGGVMTINWHHRSIGPERFWDSFYLRMLDELKREGAWIGTAKQVVEWFNKRRSVVFNRVHLEGDKILMKVSHANKVEDQNLVLRVQYPWKEEADYSGLTMRKIEKTDLPFSGELDTAIYLRR